MDQQHREQLRRAGTAAEAIDGLAWRQVTEPLPSWWPDNGNALYLADGASVPDRVVADLGEYEVSGVVVAVGSAHPHLSRLMIGGDDATVFLGDKVVLTAGEIYCGAGSQVVLHGPITATRSAQLDARNGGSIVVQPDQLWAAMVQIATDDMHRLFDRDTGERINSFGAHIRIGSHVWLAREAVVTGHVEIGDGAVVGMRSVVRGQKVPAHTAVGGVPARVLRENIDWSEADLP